MAAWNGYRRELPPWANYLIVAACFVFLFVMGAINS